MARDAVPDPGAERPRALDEYLRPDRIKVDPARNAGRVTLHDPCNLVRWGGVIEPQRRVLRRVVADFVEMTPNREQNFCCGGGGGLLSLEEYGERRVRSGRIKADQIRATGLEDRRHALPQLRGPADRALARLRAECRDQVGRRVGLRGAGPGLVPVRGDLVDGPDRLLDSLFRIERPGGEADGAARRRAHVLVDQRRALQAGSRQIPYSTSRIVPTSDGSYPATVIEQTATRRSRSRVPWSVTPLIPFKPVPSGRSARSHGDGSRECPSSEASPGRRPGRRCPSG